MCKYVNIGRKKNSVKKCWSWVVSGSFVFERAVTVGVGWRGFSVF